MRSALLRTIPILLCANYALCWGDMGHRAIAYLSQQYMTPKAIERFDHIIRPDNRFDISDAAVWADRHRNGTWEYTYNWHFIDARDNPPTHCAVNYRRDCDFRGDCASHKEPGCVVSAIVNQTAQVISNPDRKQKNLALKFLFHFIGDIHQPLHVEDLGTGGTQICVKWSRRRSNAHEYYTSCGSDDHSERLHSNSVSTLKDDNQCPPRVRCKNLHQVWDSLMIEKLLDWDPPSREEDPGELLEKARALQWAGDLFDDGVGNPPLAPGDCVPVGTRAQACAMRWASESNDLICSDVLRDGLGAVEGRELSRDYYDRAVPIVKRQISKAARRLAATMNAIAEFNIDGEDGQLLLQEL